MVKRSVRDDLGYINYCNKNLPKQGGGTYGATADLEPKPTLTRGGGLKRGDLV